MSFPRYESYKDSGVEWLGEVPAHWSVTALKRAFSITLGKMLQPNQNNPDDEFMPYLRAANIQWEGVDMTDIKFMWLSRRDRKHLRLKSGDLLVSEGGDVGRSCLWTDELEYCYFQNSVNRVRARDGNSNRYLFYWISTIKSKGYIDVLCNKSTIAHFTAEKVAAVPVPLPPQTEQFSIANFLDRETTKIDELIAEQQRLIELLKEKRQAVISQAVTKGLTPDVPMKDSGVEWLGEVPKEWDIRKIKYLFEIKKRIAGTDGYDVLSITQQGIKIKDIESGDGQLSMDYSKYQFVEAGDFAMNHMDLLTGYVDISSVLGVTSPDYRVFTVRNKKDCFDRYYLYLFQIGYRDKIFYAFGQGSSQLGRWRFPTDQFNCFQFPYPPTQEQKEIANFLDRETTKIDELIAEFQQSIDLLKERRTALISAAVTGKIDVRKFV